MEKPVTGFLTARRKLYRVLVHTQKDHILVVKHFMAAIDRDPHRLKRTVERKPTGVRGDGRAVGKALVGNTSAQLYTYVRPRRMGEAKDSR